MLHAIQPREKRSKRKKRREKKRKKERKRKKVIKKKKVYHTDTFMITVSGNSGRKSLLGVRMYRV